LKTGPLRPPNDNEELNNSLTRGWYYVPSESELTVSVQSVDSSGLSGKVSGSAAACHASSATPAKSVRPPVAASSPSVVEVGCDPESEALCDIAAEFPVAANPSEEDNSTSDVDLSDAISDPRSVQDFLSALEKEGECGKILCVHQDEGNSTRTSSNAAPAAADEKESADADSMEAVPLDVRRTRAALECVLAPTSPAVASSLMLQSRHNAEAGPSGLSVASASPREVPANMFVSTRDDERRPLPERLPAVGMWASVIKLKKHFKKKTKKKKKKKKKIKN